MPRKRFLFFLVTFLLLSCPMVAGFPSVFAKSEPTTSQSIPLESLWLTGRDFADGAGENLQISRAGVTLAPSQDRAVYVSAPLDAPIPFNTLVPRWRGVALADPANFRFYVRSGESLSELEWVEIQVDEDMTLPEDEVMTGGFYMLPVMSQTHRQLQVRVELQRPAGTEAPRLESLELTFIDTSAAPTPAEAIARQQAESAAAPEATAGFPKPFVVSRSVWCTDPACNYSDGLYYYPVSHLILHHTVTSADNPIAALQAIWKYHTFTRGWGDVGYNYLVDQNGVLYEGHLGGDNVVGTHAGGANTGSLGLSMIGDYTNVTPPAAMQEAIVKLFAWKADQMGIDVFDASRLPYMDWGSPHLMGHRDAYGTTHCPGDTAYPLLPAIRDEVARRIGFSPEHIYYDEISAETNFVKSTRPGDDYWWNGPLGCGYNGHSYYTWSVTDATKSTNWAEWAPEVPFHGRFELSVYAPYCRTGEGDTAGAVYEIDHAQGRSLVSVNQGANLGLWSSLGNYEFAAGTAGRLRLTDLTSTDSGLGVWFDAIRLRPLSPYVATATPADGEWSADSEVGFDWTLTNGVNVAQQTLQVATTPDFANLLVDIPLAHETRHLARAFGDGHYFWRIALTTHWGERFTSPAWSFGVDTTPPTSAVVAVYQYLDGTLFVRWEGEDANSGVVGYNIEYRAEGTEEWRSWLHDIRQTGAPFTPPRPDTVYWFRSQARDRLGWLEPFPVGTGDISTAERIVMTSQISLPLLHKE